MYAILADLVGEPGFDIVFSVSKGIRAPILANDQDGGDFRCQRRFDVDARITHIYSILCLYFDRIQRSLNDSWIGLPNSDFTRDDDWIEPFTEAGPGEESVDFGWVIVVCYEWCGHSVSERLEQLDRVRVDVEIIFRPRAGFLCNQRVWGQDSVSPIALATRWIFSSKGV